MRKHSFTSGNVIVDVVACTFIFIRDWLGVQCTLVQDRNALDGCPGIEKEGRFQRRKAMGRYRL